MPVAQSGVFELTLMPVFGSTKVSTKSESGQEQKDTKDLTQVNATVLYDHKCLQNLHAYSAVGFTWQSEVDTDADLTTKSTIWSVTPFGLRYHI